MTMSGSMGTHLVLIVIVDDFTRSGHQLRASRLQHRLQERLEKNNQCLLFYARVQ